MARSSIYRVGRAILQPLHRNHRSTLRTTLRPRAHVQRHAPSHDTLLPIASRSSCQGSKPIGFLAWELALKKQTRTVSGPGISPPSYQINHRPAITWPLMLPFSYRDVFSRRGWGGDRIAVLPQARQMKFNCLADQILCFIQRFGGDAKTGQVGNIGSPTSCGLLVDD